MNNCKAKSTIWGLLLVWIILVAINPVSSYANETSGEKLYADLVRIANGKGDVKFFQTLNETSGYIDWQQATELEFAGNLRRLKANMPPYHVIYLLRKLTSEVYILAVPKDPSMLAKDADSAYAGLDDMLQNKMVFKVGVAHSVIDGQTYDFAQLMARPQPVTLNRIFKLFIFLMLFSVMVGLGQKLTLRKIGLVFKKPRGIFVGEILQFGIMPLLAFGLGHLLGFNEGFPFIFVGLILITASPGGVTSNLMTYYAKGDLALSISLTCFSTVLSLFLTPLVLAIYCTNLPEVTVPVKLVVQTILFLMIFPLIIGMSIRAKLPTFAKKAVPFFSALGFVALLILIIAGVLSNLNAFSDTARYSLKFYATVFTLTFLGMMIGMLISKLTGINNYQTRAISLETGLRNASLAMAIALLIQDARGDFYSSMFFTSVIFGVFMYLAGLISIFIYKPLLPVRKSD